MRRRHPTAVSPVPATLRPNNPWANDPVAQSTSWTPHRNSSGNWDTLEFVRVSPTRLEIKPTSRSWRVVFLFCGLSVAFPWYFVSTATNTIQKVVAYFFGVIWGIAGLYTAWALRCPVWFDKHLKRFTRGDPHARSLPFMSREYVTCELADIHAIQLLEFEGITHKGKRYEAHELNLVLKDSRRLLVVSHGDATKIRADADIIARFLAVPVWDAT